MSQTIIADARWHGTQANADASIDVVFEDGNGGFMTAHLPFSEALSLAVSLEQALRSAEENAGQSPAHQPNRPIQLTARKPAGLTVSKEPMNGDPLLIFDAQTPRQLAIQIPRRSVAALAQLLLPFLRDEDQSAEH